MQWLAAAPAPAIFLLTLYLVIRRPRNLPAHAAALLGMALALATGVVTWADVRTVWGLVWNATLALVGILTISGILDEAGFFRWAALHLVRRAGGDGRRLLVAVVLLGAVTSALFTNDTTVLILTPIVCELLAAMGIRGRAALPYLMACGFVADALSVPLPVSNLTNIIAADFFGLPFGRFAARMFLPTLATLAATLALIFWYYRRDIPARCGAQAAGDPAAAVRDPFLFRAGAGVLAGMALFFAFGHALGIPAAAVMGGGAAVLVLATRVRGVVDPVPVLRRAPWGVVAFALGMFLVVYGLGKVGLTDLVARAVAALAAWHPGAAVVGTGLLVALLASAMNNLPGVLVGALAVAAAPVAALLREGLALAAVIGADIGPKLTPIGSLATLIWLHVLAARGVHISWRSYMAMGLAVTPPVLLAALLALWGAVALG